MRARWGWLLLGLASVTILPWNAGAAIGRGAVLEAAANGQVWLWPLLLALVLACMDRSAWQAAAGVAGLLWLVLVSSGIGVSVSRSSMR